MKFRDFIKKDKLLNKGTKNKRLRESSERPDYEVNGDGTSLTSIITKITEKIESTDCPVLKTKCMLDIIYLLISHLDKSFDYEDDEILIEKK